MWSAIALTGAPVHTARSQIFLAIKNSWIKCLFHAVRPSLLPVLVSRFTANKSSTCDLWRKCVHKHRMHGAQHTHKRTHKFQFNILAEIEFLTRNSAHNYGSETPSQRVVIILMFTLNYLRFRWMLGCHFHRPSSHRRTVALIQFNCDFGLAK